MPPHCLADLEESFGLEEIPPAHMFSVKAPAWIKDPESLRAIDSAGTARGLKE